MKNKKKIIAWLMAVVLCFGLSACTARENTEPTATAEKGTHTVVDHLDNTVEVPDKIERIVVADIYPLPSVLAVFFDSAEKLVGIAPNSMNAAKNSLLSELYPEILNASTSFTDGTTINTEELQRLNPDIVFYSSGNTKQGEQLKNAGFTAVAVSADKWNYNAIETLKEWIKLFGQIFNDNGKIQKVNEYSEKAYSLVTQRIKNLKDDERQRVFFLFQYSETNILTSGKSFFGQWWAESIGAVNVAQELTNNNSVPVNMEQIYKWNPSLIFITNFTPSKPVDLYDNTVGSYDWSEVKAVKTKNVYKMPLGMYRSYTAGVDTPLTLLYLAKCAYPEIFSDIDINSEVKTYYKDIFDITLTDEQAERIFSPLEDASK